MLFAIVSRGPSYLANGYCLQMSDAQTHAQPCKTRIHPRLERKPQILFVPHPVNSEHRQRRSPADRHAS